MARAVVHSIELSVEEHHVTRLRHEQALSGELLFQADRAAIRANAHRPGRFESNENILRTITNCHRLRLDLRRVDGQRGFVFDAHVNRAGIESHCERAGGFQHRQMRRTTNGNLAAFYEVNSRTARFNTNFTAASQDGFHLTVDDAQGAGKRDRLAVNDANRVSERLIRARNGASKQRKAKYHNAGGQPCAAQEPIRIEKGRHPVALPVSNAETLAYTICRLAHSGTSQK